MRIARTYVLALLASLVLFVSAYGYFAVSREIARYEAEVGESHAVMGNVLRQALLEVLDSDGEDPSLARVQDADVAKELERRVGGRLQRITVDEDGTRRLTTYVSLAATPAVGAL